VTYIVKTTTYIVSLDDKLVLDVLSGKVSRDYECVIKLGQDFETVAHELRTYFGFFKLRQEDYKKKKNFNSHL
jgi:hypothetical protein